MKNKKNMTHIKEMVVGVERQDTRQTCEEDIIPTRLAAALEGAPGCLKSPKIFSEPCLLANVITSPNQ